MIILSNGYKFTFCCASGALGFDGKGWPWEQPFRLLGLLNPKAFTVVAKTVTYYPIKGNLSLWHPWTCVRLLRPLSAVNAVGLTNPGLRYWLKHYYTPGIVLSLKIDNYNEAVYIHGLLEDYEFKAPYIELNISCPNTKDSDTFNSQILARLGSLNIPIVLKLSETQIDEHLISAVDDFISAYHAINTIPWNDMFYTKSPLEKLGGGGVSGKLIKNRALSCIKKLSSMTDKPIIGGGGITEYDDINHFWKAGASAFSIGTLFLYKPWRPNQIVKRFYAQS